MFGNINGKSKKYFETLTIIFLIVIATYSIMAIITHFSLNYKFDDYKLTDSILSIFDRETAIFKFFIGFIILIISWILSAMLIKYIKDKIKRR